MNTHIIKWNSRYTDGHGEIGPMSQELANRIAANNNRLFPDIKHQVEEIKSVIPS